MAATPREHASAVAPLPHSAALPKTAGVGREAVLERLIAKPKNFSFVQALRLLILCGREEYAGQEAFLRRGVKIVPELSLAHPSTDIVSIQDCTPPPVRDDNAPEGSPQSAPLSRYTMTATFLSLYGTSSPLPTFYTEELLEEARQDTSASRDFLDIFNQTLYRLYYRAYNKYKLGFRTREQQDAGLRHLQYCLLGMGDENLRRSAGTRESDLRFIGQFTRHARSASGLKFYLGQRAGHADMQIEQCVERHMPIPADQLCRLGQARLNGESAIGIRIHDRSGKFRIHLRGMDDKAMQRFAPGGESRSVLENAVRQYLNIPLSYDLVRHAAPNSLNGTRLGQDSRLGVASVLTVPAQNPARAYISYQPAER